MRRTKTEIAAFRALEPCDHKYYYCKEIGCQMPKECKAAGHPRNKYGRCNCGEKVRIQPAPRSGT